MHCPGRVRARTVRAVPVSRLDSVASGRAKLLVTALLLRRLHAVPPGTGMQVQMPGAVPHCAPHRLTQRRVALPCPIKTQLLLRRRLVFGYVALY